MPKHRDPGATADWPVKRDLKVMGRVSGDIQPLVGARQVSATRSPCKPNRTAIVLTKQPTPQRELINVRPNHPRNGQGLAHHVLVAHVGHYAFGRREPRKA